MINEFKKYYSFLESDILMDYIGVNAKSNPVDIFKVVDYVKFNNDTVEITIVIGYFGETEIVEMSNGKFNELLAEYSAHYNEETV